VFVREIGQRNRRRRRWSD